MKKLVLIFAFLLFVFALAASVFAAHLVTNPDACDYYVVAGLPASFTAAANVPGDPTGKAGMSLDVSGLPAVTTDTQFTVTAACCRRQDATHTGGCVVSSPFVFTQTAPPTIPSGMAVAP